MESQDLVAFRIALRESTAILPTEELRKELRYTPTGPFSRAKVTIGSDQTQHDADVVDLSPSGMRLALGPGIPCHEGDRVCIEMTLSQQQTLHLNGEIRWTKHHPYITVFGVLLDPDNSPVQPV